MMSKSVLYTSRPSISVKDFSLEEIVSFIRGKLKGKGVEKAYIFGSTATNETTHWSDIDILIVTNTALPFIERPKEFLDLFDLGIPIDILVYTPTEFEDLMKSSTGFWKGFKSTKLRII